MRNGAAPHQPYDPDVYPALFLAEQRHFWFRHRSEVIALMARTAWGDRQGGRVLEVGCGTGHLLPVLARNCRGALVVGLEMLPEGLRFARQRASVPLVAARVEHLPFAGPFDVIGAFDVLEHIPDDIGALRHLGGVLGASGALLITVPAHEALWSAFDDAAGHVRRYTPRTIEAALTRAGFRIELSTYFMLPLFPLVWANRRLRGSSATGADAITRELHVADPVNRVMRQVLKLETRWLARSRTLPFGTSIAVIARKAAAQR